VTRVVCFGILKEEMDLGKAKCPRCTVCAWSTVGARKHPKVMYTMHGLYIKKQRAWRRVGWICLRCGSVVLDNMAFSLARPVEPKIQVKAPQKKNISNV